MVHSDVFLVTVEESLNKVLILSYNMMDILKPHLVKFETEKKGISIKLEFNSPLCSTLNVTPKQKLGSVPWQYLNVQYIPKQRL